MKSFNRYEVMGIIASVAVLVAALIMTRGTPSVSTKKPAMPVQESDIVRVSADASDTSTALARAVASAVNIDGDVTKLIIHDVAIGDGREVRTGDTVTIHYIGVEKDGPQFADSYTKGEPSSFQVGAGEVVAGLEQGIIGMKERGKRILVVPPALGYGSAIVEPLSSHATLFFSVELLSIQ